MGFDLKNKAIECLSDKDNRNKEFEATEMATWILEKHPNDCQNKKENSKNPKILNGSNNDLIQQIAGEINRSRHAIQKACPAVKTIEGPPRKFCYSDSNESYMEEEVPIIAKNSEDTDIKEEELYPILKDFLLSEGILSMRIDEKKHSSKSRSIKGKWLYPDIVGMEDLSEGWHSVIKSCVTKCSDKKFRLWSFEVKLVINRSNIREAFFQTVSNSSWANFGYLVSTEIKDEDVSKELRMLCNLHGIGFIELDVEKPSNNYINIHAREKTDIDWATANRLVEANSDFKEYISRVNDFYAGENSNRRLKDWGVKVEDDVKSYENN